MDEVLNCSSCNIQFHQSFLSAHVEAYHVELRKEEMITISCPSCLFSVDVLHKNSMVQHCLITGHSIRDVDTQFHSYLLSERARIQEILDSSFELLNSNIQQSAEKALLTSPIKARQRSSAKKRKREPVERRIIEDIRIEEDIIKDQAIDTSFETENLSQKPAEQQEKVLNEASAKPDYMSIARKKKRRLFSSKENLEAFKEAIRKSLDNNDGNFLRVDGDFKSELHRVVFFLKEKSGLDLPFCQCRKCEKIYAYRKNMGTTHIRNHHCNPI